MKKRSKDRKVPQNQLRFEIPHYGCSSQCKDCPYLVTVNDEIFQCAGTRDHWHVVSEGALCQNKPISSRVNDLSVSDTDHNQLTNQTPKTQFIEYEHCPRCDTLLTKSGCYICPTCGYRDCA